MYITKKNLKIKKQSTYSEITIRRAVCMDLLPGLFQMSGCENLLENQTETKYNYYLTSTECIYTLICYINSVGIGCNLVELGSGPGILRLIIKPFVELCSYIGFEIEPKLVEMGKHLLNSRYRDFHGSVFQKDILTLEREDVSEADIIYFWEPLINKEMQKKFAKLLYDIVDDKQIIFYLCSGSMKYYLETYFHITIEPNTYDCLYMLKKK